MAMESIWTTIYEPATTSELLSMSDGEPMDGFATPSFSPPSSNWHKDFIQMIWLISGPIIFVVGMCGNSLVLVVMTRRQMTGTSTCVHLCIMAVADMVVLTIGLVPEWFEFSFNLKFKELHPVTCKLEKILFYTSSDTSIWVLVIFTLDRLVAIAFPFHKRTICVPSRARLFGGLVFLTAVIKNFHVFWTRGPEYKTVDGNVTVLISNCGKPTPGYANFESFVRPWIVFTTVNVIPFVTILLCNVVIIRALFRVRRVATIGALVSQSASDRSMIQMTTMCLSASFCFLICITPSIVLIIGRPYWDKTTPYELAKGVSNFFTYINHSVNFFLYCVTGRKFRRQLAWICCSWCSSDDRDSSGESTFAETHGTFLGRGSVFGIPRKSSVGLLFFGKPSDSRRGSRDETAEKRQSPAFYQRSNSQVASKIAARKNSCDVQDGESKGHPAYVRSKSLVLSNPAVVTNGPEKDNGSSKGSSAYISINKNFAIAENTDETHV